MRLDILSGNNKSHFNSIQAVLAERGINFQSLTGFTHDHQRYAYAIRVMLDDIEGEDDDLIVSSNGDLSFKELMAILQRLPKFISNKLDIQSMPEMDRGGLMIIYGFSKDNTNFELMVIGV